MHLESDSRRRLRCSPRRINGFGGTDARLVFNNPLHVKHIGNLQEMVKKGYFSYGGRKAESQTKFFNGECAMFTGSSASLANIRTRMPSSSSACRNCRTTRTCRAPRRTRSSAARRCG